MIRDELIDFLFDGQPHALAEPVTGWVYSSRRFAEFATTFRHKIRKKLRATTDHESLLDLRLELETACWLLRERALSVVYEPQDRGQGRSPDFAVSFTTSMVFMVEVTRVRANSDPASGVRVAERVADTIGSKLGQLMSQRSNVLVIGVGSEALPQAELRTAMLDLQQRAERSDAVLFQRHHVRDRSDFFQRLHRLSEVLVRGPQLHVGGPPTVWTNPQARYPLPSKIRTALHRSHTA